MHMLGGHLIFFESCCGLLFMVFSLPAAAGCFPFPLRVFQMHVLSQFKAEIALPVDNFFPIFS